MIHDVVMAETVSLRVVGGVVKRTGRSARISSLELNCFMASFSVGSIVERHWLELSGLSDEGN